MLVLTRKLGEGIQIDAGITVTVVEVRGNKVRLGIEAPSDIRVLRQELAPQESSPAADNLPVSPVDSNPAPDVVTSLEEKHSCESSF
jgi:carbon storage regulator CsrA